MFFPFSPLTIHHFPPLSFHHITFHVLSTLLKRHRYVKMGILLLCNPSVVCACHQGVMGAPISDATYLTILCKSNEVLTMKLWGFAKCDSQWWDAKSTWIWSYSPYEQAKKSSLNYSYCPVIYFIMKCFLWHIKNIVAVTWQIVKASRFWSVTKSTWKPHI